MKKIFTSLLMLMALLCSTTAWAEDYGIKVAGVSVTDANKSNITGSGISGKVTYDPTNKRLEFAEGTVITTSSDGIANRGVDDLSIMINGTLTVNTSCSDNTAAALFCSKNTKITNWSGNKSPILKLNNTGAGNAIRSYQGANITIYNMRITANAANNDAVRANGAANLAINYSRLEAEAGSGYAGITGFTNGLSMSFSGTPTSVITTSGATFDSTTGGVVKSGSLLQKVSIEPSISIGGLNIGWNSYTLTPSLTGASAASGKVSMNWSTKTLTVTDVDITNAGWNFRLPGLNVVFDGSDPVIKNSSTVFNIGADTKFSSNGTLYLTCTGSNSAFSTYNNANVEICMKELQAQGGNYGFYGQSTSKLTLTRPSGVSCKYKFRGDNCNIYTGEIVMNDIDFWTGHTYLNPNDHKVYYNGDVAHGTGSIESYDATWFASTDLITYYGLTVAGTAVNSRNYEEILSPYITSGKASYDNSSKTLTLEAVSINVTDASTNVIKKTSSGDLTIKFAGTEKQYLKAKNDAIDLSSGTTTFTGEASSYVESTEESGITTRNEASVTLNTSNFVEVKGKKYGYYGCNSANEKLTLKKETSDLKAYRFIGEEGIIYSVTDFVLDNMDFWQGFSTYLPACYFDNKRLMQNGSIAKGQVAFGSIQEKLPIFICGKQLNKVSNNTDYTIYVGSPFISSGTQSVGYNPVTKTLTLNNAIIDFNPSSFANNGAIETANGSELIIDVSGDNKLTAPKAYSAMWLRNSNVTIQGSGNLSLSGNSDDLYAMNESTLAIKGDVTLEAMDKGIGSNNYAKEFIIGENAVVKAKHISYVRTLTLEDGHSIVEPQGATFSDNAVRVGSSLAQNVVIMKVEDYGLSVCDVAVNSYNCDDLLGDGKFKYDNSTKTLTVSNANIDNNSIQDLIKNTSVDGLKVNFVGDNSFKVHENIFYLCKTTTISGTGTIDGELYSGSGYGIFIQDNLDVTLDGATFKFKGQKGISTGGNTYTVNMTINSGKFIFEPTSTGYCGMEYLTSLTLGTGMVIKEPAGGYYDATLKALTVNGSDIYTGAILIEGVTNLGMSIAGTTVTDVNCGDILGNGVFKYDASSKTLTINGNYTFTGSSNLISSQIDGLTINVAGNSTLVSSADETIIRLWDNTTITGGKLTLMCTAPSNDGLGIWIENAQLTIKDADIDVTGDGFSYGITGDVSSQLLVDNSNVTVSAHQYGAIYDWGGITLTNCYVDEPRPSIIDAKGIQDGEGNYYGFGLSETTTVVIKAGADAIEDINVAQTRTTEVYDAAGRRLNESRRGINIVRTADGKTRKFVKK